jgi:hypothetical protein
VDQKRGPATSVTGEGESPAASQQMARRP